MRFGWVRLAEDRLQTSRFRAECLVLDSALPATYPRRQLSVVQACAPNPGAYTPLRTRPARFRAAAGDPSLSKSAHWPGRFAISPRSASRRSRVSMSRLFAYTSLVWWVTPDNVRDVLIFGRRQRFLRRVSDVHAGVTGRCIEPRQEPPLSHTNRQVHGPTRSANSRKKRPRPRFATDRAKQRKTLITDPLVRVSLPLAARRTSPLNSHRASHPRRCPFPDE